MRPLDIAAALTVAGSLFASSAFADVTKPVSIAVLNDKSSVFSDAGGVGSVVAAQLAIDDLGGKVRGQPIVLQGPDHQNKVDVGTALARNLYDQQGVDAIFDIGNSAISAFTGTHRPWILVSRAPSSNLRPRVPAAWKPENSRVLR